MQTRVKLTSYCAAWFHDLKVGDTLICSQKKKKERKKESESHGEYLNYVVFLTYPISPLHTSKFCSEYNHKSNLLVSPTVNFFVVAVGIPVHIYITFHFY